MEHLSPSTLARVLPPTVSSLLPQLPRPDPFTKARLNAIASYGPVQSLLQKPFLELRKISIPCALWGDAEGPGCPGDLVYGPTPWRLEAAQLRPKFCTSLRQSSWSARHRILEFGFWGWGGPRD